MLVMSAAAQSGKQPPAPPPYFSLDAQVAERIGLVSEQQAQWNALGARVDKDYKALGADPTHNAGYRPLLDDRETALKALLTSDQYSKWLEMNHNTGGDKNTAPKARDKN